MKFIDIGLLLLSTDFNGFLDDINYWGIEENMNATHCLLLTSEKWDMRPCDVVHNIICETT